MKKALLLLALACLCAATLNAQDTTRYVDATSLTITGKIFTDTPNPYHRIDTVRFKGFTTGENLQVRETSGLGVAFRTDSPFIRIKATYGYIPHQVSTMGIAAKGFDLYIRKDGKWLWAGSKAGNDGHEEEPLTIVKNMDGSSHDCLLYLPLISELYSLEIGVKEGSSIEALPNPFRGRIAIFGSSFTQGISCARAGMAYPAQISRMTGLQLLSLGCSGNCKLQPYFADALAAADVDAFIFDSFSNPTPKQVHDRLFPFIEKIQAAHPGKPLIFQGTIYRERRNFDQGHEASEAARIHMADSLMKIACKRYKDVYYIQADATAPSHETSVDGVHPSDYGYTLWAESVAKDIARILRKYGIK